MFEVKVKIDDGGRHAVMKIGAAEAETVDGTTEQQLRQSIIDRAAAAAHTNGAPVRLILSQSNGVFNVNVSPTGRVTPDDHGDGGGHGAGSDEWTDSPTLHTHQGATGSASAAPTSADTISITTLLAPAASVAMAPMAGISDIPRIPRAHQASRDAGFRHHRATGSSPGDEEALVARRSFLSTEKQAAATHGWRAVVARTTGITLAPSPAAEAHNNNLVKVSQHWPGGCSIAVVNGKGGVGKTTTTAMLAAVFARHGGSGVVAWDNNDTRGTLGWRTEASDHGSTIPDLLTAAEQLLQRSASLADLARFVHHQSADMYDVLRSNPTLLATEQRLTAGQFDCLNEVIEKYSRMIVFDSGNDESSDRWLRMIDRTHQLVLPTTPAGESAESAALLLEELRQRDSRSAALAERAVVIVCVSERATPAADVARIVEGFQGVARATVVIPYDPALKSGPLRFDSLRPATRRAWISAGAAVADGLRGH